MPTRPSPLAAEFEPADEARWRALVEKGLKGRAFGELTATTADGLAIQPLYTSEAAGPLLRARPAPASDPDRPWDLRTVVKHPDPTRANEQVLEDLNGGAQSVLLELDVCGLDGIEIDDQDDLARVLDGVLLDLAPVALDAGPSDLDAADWLAVLAKGAPNARLAFHIDPVSWFAVRGFPGGQGSVGDRIAAGAQIAARHAGAYPRATAFLASGRAAHEAGGSEAQELGLMAASASAYLRSMVDEAGMAPADAFGRVVLGLAANEEPLVTAAKLRAAGAIWARLAQLAGVEAPAKIEARSSRRMLSRRDAWTNQLRLTAAAFGAGIGGADAVVLDPFTEALGHPMGLARRQARNAQLVLMEEAHLGRVADPAGGAWALERLTDDLARAGWAAFQAMESEGGVVAALKTGRFQAEVVATRSARQAAIAEKRAPILGVTVFPNAHDTPPEVERQVPEPGRDHICPDKERCDPLAPVRWSAPFEEARS